MTRRRLAIAAAALAALLLLTQLFLPGIAERRVADRLTERGGEADVEIGAVPALRLLFGDGSRLRVRGRGIDIDLANPERAELSDLDGFGEVDVAFEELVAGPVAVSRLSLRRDSGERDYDFQLSASVSPRELATAAAEQIGGTLAGVGGGLAATLLLPPEPVPFELALLLRSEDGRPRVVDGGGTIAGFPAGPLAEAIAAAVVARL